MVYLHSTYDIAQRRWQGNLTCMVDYQRKELEDLLPDEILLLSTFVTPSHPHLLAPSQPTPPILWIAYQDRAPIGMIAAYSYPPVHQAQIVSLYVQSTHWLQGVATTLVKYMLSYLKAQDIQIVHCRYNLWEPSALPVESILKSAHWSPPSLLARHYYFDPHTFNPPWFTSLDPLLSKEFALFEWKDALQQDLIEAKKWENMISGAYQYSPFESTVPIAWLNSLGLRYQDTLVGWMIAHRPTPHILRYSALFVRPDLRGTSAAVGLVKESVRRHVLIEPDSLGLIEINFLTSSPYWIRFVQRKLAPWAVKTEDVNYAYTQIT